MRWCVLPILLFSIVGSGCVPETEVLSGWWMSRNISQNPDDSVVSDTGIELVLGHFGPDVAGVVRFYQGQFESDEYKGHNRQAFIECPCSFLENGHFRSENRFTFRVDLGEECSFPGIADTSALLFSLELDEDDTLDGILETINGENVQPLRFVRDNDEDYVRETDKQCKSVSLSQ